MLSGRDEGAGGHPRPVLLAEIGVHRDPGALHAHGTLRLHPADRFLSVLRGLARQAQVQRQALCREAEALRWQGPEGDVREGDEERCRPAAAREHRVLLQGVAGGLVCVHADGVLRGRNAEVQDGGGGEGGGGGRRGSGVPRGAEAGVGGGGRSELPGGPRRAAPGRQAREHPSGRRGNVPHRGLRARGEDGRRVGGGGREIPRPRAPERRRSGHAQGGRVQLWCCAIRVPLRSWCSEKQGGD